MCSIVTPTEEPSTQCHFIKTASYSQTKSVNSILCRGACMFDETCKRKDTQYPSPHCRYTVVGTSDCDLPQVYGGYIYIKSKKPLNMALILPLASLFCMGVDMICNVGGLMTIAREVREKFPPSY